MSRYQTLQTAGVWTVLDRLTREILGGTSESRSEERANALTSVLNCLDDQESWRAQAALRPAATAA